MVMVGARAVLDVARCRNTGYRRPLTRNIYHTEKYHKRIDVRIGYLPALVATALGSTLISHHSDAKASHRCLTNVDFMVFAIYNGQNAKQ